MACSIGTLYNRSQMNGIYLNYIAKQRQLEKKVEEPHTARQGTEVPVVDNTCKYANTMMYNLVFRLYTYHITHRTEYKQVFKN